MFVFWSPKGNRILKRQVPIGTCNRYLLTELCHQSNPADSFLPHTLCSSLIFYINGKTSGLFQTTSHQLFKVTVATEATFSPTNYIHMPLFFNWKRENILSPWFNFQCFWQTSILTVPLKCSLPMFLIGLFFSIRTWHRKLPLNGNQWYMNIICRKQGWWRTDCSIFFLMSIKK